MIRSRRGRRSRAGNAVGIAGFGIIGSGRRARRRSRSSWYRLCERLRLRWGMKGGGWVGVNLGCFPAPRRMRELRVLSQEAGTGSALAVKFGGDLGVPTGDLDPPREPFNGGDEITPGMFFGNRGSRGPRRRRGSRDGELVGAHLLGRGKKGRRKGWEAARGGPRDLLMSSLRTSARLGQREGTEGIPTQSPSSSNEGWSDFGFPPRRGQTRSIFLPGTHKKKLD